MASVKHPAAGHPSDDGAATFDVFLSYNGNDRAQVATIADRLRAAGVNPWFDRWQLTPGGAWQEELHAGLHASNACAYFIGPGGEGDWSRMELEVARSRAANDRGRFRLFPVLLPGLPDPFDRTTLPPFLSQRTWVDLRPGVADRQAFQALINAIKGVPTGAPKAPVLTARPPYRGLQAFDETHAEFYFGRDADIQRLLEKLRGGRFLAVLGPSGSGKSSLVRAGLIPAVRRGAIPGSDVWPIRLIRPGRLPLTTLATDLADSTSRSPAAVLDELASDERTLHLATESTLRAQPPGVRLCWVIDQAEELFTLCRDEAERAALAANVAYAAAIPGGRTVAILTIRADFYARLAAYPDLAALVADSQYLVSPLDPDGLRAAIEEPARLVGLEFEAGLTDTILEDVVDRPGALPLLEHALLELWERRRGSMLTLEAYRESGGVEGAVAKRAEAIFTSFTSEEQETARRAMLRLTEPGEGTEDTRRRAPLSELVTTQAKAGAVEAVVNRLADARLLTVSAGQTPADAWVDLSHEALIRGWPRVRAWIDENRESLRVHRRITDAARDWEGLGRDPDQLYRGARLAEALEWRSEHEAELNDLERDFLDASQAARDAQTRATQRRRRLALIGSLGLSAVLLVLTGFAAVQWQNAEREGRIAFVHQLATQSRLPGVPVARALLVAAEARKLADVDVDAEAVRQADGSLVHLLLARPALERILPPSARVNSVAFSPDGHKIASAGRDRLVILWDAATGSKLKVFGHTDDVNSVAFSPDRRTLASAGDDGRVILWDIASGKKIAEPTESEEAEATDEPPAVESVAFSPDPDGRTLAWADDNGRIILWDVASRLTRVLMDEEDVDVHSVAFSRDGRTLASGDSQKRVILWDVESGSRRELPGHDDSVHGLAFSPVGNILASASSGDGKVLLWDLANLREDPQPLRGHMNAQSVAFSPDGLTLASSGDDRKVILWDVETASKKVELTGHTGFVRSVAFSPDGQTLAAADVGIDTTILLWDPASGAKRELIGHTEPVESVAFSPDGQSLVSGSRDGKVILWNPVGKTKTELTEHEDSEIEPQSEDDVLSVAFSNDGTLMASSDRQGRVLLRNLATGSETTELPVHEDEVGSIAFSPDGMTLATAGDDWKVILWDIASRKGTELPDGHDDAVQSVAFSSDGKLLASAGDDDLIILWDVATLKKLGPLPNGHSDDVRTVAFSSDGKLLASGGDDRTLIVWDVVSGKKRHELTGHRDFIHSVAFSADGRTLASASDDGIVILWDVEHGTKLTELTDHKPTELPDRRKQVRAVAFSPTGRTLASAGDDTTVILREIDRGDLINRACAIAGRNLTRAEWDQQFAQEPPRATCPQWPGPS